MDSAMNYRTAKWSEVVHHEFGFDWNISYNTPFPRPLPMADRVIETTVPVETESGPLNCVVWSPNGEPLQRPLVLLGHGGSGHKKSPYLVWFAMRLVTDYNFVAAAIDHLPQPGDRGGVSDIRTSVDWTGSSETFDEAIDSIVDYWQATIRTLVNRIEVDETKIGYWGYSGGTLMGIPLLAKTPGISAAALGKWGLEAKPELTEIFDEEFPIVAARHKRDASGLKCPIHYLINMDDNLFTQCGQIELFNRLGSYRKALWAEPGDHVAESYNSVAYQLQFLGDTLTDKQ